MFDVILQNFIKWGIGIFPIIFFVSFVLYSLVDIREIQLSPLSKILINFFMGASLAFWLHRLHELLERL